MRGNEVAETKLYASLALLLDKMDGLTSPTQQGSTRMHQWQKNFPSVRHYIQIFKTDHFFGELLKLFLCIDIFFILAYALSGILKVAGILPEISSLQLTNAVGLASIWNYAKLMIAVAALVLFWKSDRSASALIMIGLFVFLLVDDYYELHDLAGRYVGERLSIEALSSLHPQDSGELFVYSAIMATVIPLLWIAFSKAQPDERLFIRALAASVVLLGLFGVAVDIVHGVLEVLLSFLPELLLKVFNRLMTILEDGGEMVAITVCAWICLVNLAQQRNSGKD